MMTYNFNFLVHSDIKFLKTICIKPKAFGRCGTLSQDGINSRRCRLTCNSTSIYA